MFVAVSLRLRQHIEEEPDGCDHSVERSVRQHRAKQILRFLEQIAVEQAKDQHRNLLERLEICDRERLQAKVDVVEHENQRGPDNRGPAPRTCRCKTWHSANMLPSVIISCVRGESSFAQHRFLRQPGS